MAVLKINIGIKMFEYKQISKKLNKMIKVI